MAQNYIRIADGVNLKVYASVFTNAPADDTPALVVRNIPSGIQTVSITSTPSTSSFVQLTDGYHSPIITNAAPGTNDYGLVVRGAGNFIVTQSTASNLNAQVGGLGANSVPSVGNPVLIAGWDGTNTRILKTDSGGNLVSTLIPTFVSIPNTALPADTLWIGASDGTKLQGLSVESSASTNLRVGLWSGSTLATISSSNSIAGNALQGLVAQYNSILPSVHDGYTTLLQTDGYGRLIVAQPTGNLLNASIVGTVTANQGDANTQPWKIDGYGTAGSPAGGVVSVQGVTSGVPLPSIVWGTTSGGNISMPVGITNEGHLEVCIANPRSIFDEIEAVEPTPTAQIDFVYGLNSNAVITSTTGSGTATASNGLLTLSTTAATNSSASCSSKRYLKYRDGQGQVSRFTAIFTNGVSGNTQFAGIGDGYNAYGFGFNGSSFGILFRTSSSGSTVDTWIPQSTWNVDRVNGAGGTNNPSGITLNITKGNIYQIKASYLGFGPIQFWISNAITSQLILVHIIQYPNANTQTLVSNPSMPLFWFTSNTTNNTNIVVKSGSGALFCSGKIALLGSRYGQNNNKANIGATNTNIFTIKNNTTLNGIVNKTQVHLRSLSAACNSGAGNGVVTVQVILNTTLGGSPSFTNIDATNSATSFDTAGTTVSGGVVIYNSVFNVANNFNENMTDLDLFMNPGDTMTFAATSTTSATVAVAACWTEDI